MILILNKSFGPCGGVVLNPPNGGPPCIEKFPGGDSGGGQNFAIQEI